ncbi:HAAS signaling domain-containing protein [Streptomyces flavovirens]|uniref:HAAS signaling domain-containing protein n=1 Tax=Streptomyces flavovirens TaxID=52258 RepID=UPI003D0D18C7
MKAENAGATERALVERYLAAVGREASALPAQRRQELVADLAEHIEVALSERPGEARDILGELGDPRTIATTALQEAGSAGPGPVAEIGAPEPAGGSGTGRRRSPDWVVVGLPVVAMLLGILVGALGLVLRIIGVVVLCRSRHWDWNQKWVGVTVTAFLPTVIALGYNFGVSADAVPAYVPWLLTGLMLVMVAVGAGWLWKVRTPRARV